MILLLGGTTEGRVLADRLAASGRPVMSSLAGGVSASSLPAGEVRLGGFGGVAGLVDYLRSERIEAVVDATHPFAARITAHAVEACRSCGVPLLRLSRPGWGSRPDASNWHWVDSLAEARTAALGLGDRIFLAIGRQSLAEFAEVADRYVLARVIDLPDFSPTAGWTLLRARGPFDRDAELALLREHGIEVLVTKDSGGPAVAKLDAAAQLGVPVVMVRRPPVPVGVEVVDSVPAALDWLADVS